MQFRFWREMTIKEISKITGSSERAVEGKIYRAKKILKKILHTKYPEVCPAKQDPLRGTKFHAPLSVVGNCRLPFSVFMASLLRI